jgi:hypothetical protein
MKKSNDVEDQEQYEVKDLNRLAALEGITV